MIFRSVDQVAVGGSAVSGVGGWVVVVARCVAALMAEDDEQHSPRTSPMFKGAGVQAVGCAGGRTEAILAGFEDL